jgi:hypothetical protein
LRACEQPSKTAAATGPTGAEFGFAPEFAQNIQNQDHSLSRETTDDSREENALLPRAIATGIGKAMSVTSGTKSESGIGETIRVVIHALLIALVIRTFLFQPFNIPSGSMKAARSRRAAMSWCSGCRRTIRPITSSA